MGSSPRREDYIQPCADEAEVVPRRAGTKRAFPGSNAKVIPVNISFKNKQTNSMKQCQGLYVVLGTVRGEEIRLYGNL